MASRLQRRLENQQAQGIDMSPLLDVVFILLIFFIVSTVFVKETGFYGNFIAYCISRLGTLGYFAGYTIMAIRDSTEFEIHHYFVAWSMSLFACFNHPLSLIWLAIMTGIFCQGLGAYDALFFFYQQDTSI